jgi:predicted protein tyrosine phosphatase
MEQSKERYSKQSQERGFKKMNTIENISLAKYNATHNENHYEYCIRIFDLKMKPDYEKKQYPDIDGINHIVLFFNDVDRGEDYAFNTEDAASIISFLQEAKKSNKDVLVHCLAGLSRSGAVTQFAIDYMGFAEVHGTRIPNSHIYYTLVEAYTGKTIEEQVKEMFDRETVNAWTTLDLEEAL